MKFLVTAVVVACHIASSEALAAAIYLKQHPDGTVSYASQAIDEGYVLYQADEQPSLPPLPASALDTTVQKLAVKHGVDPSLVRAIASVESGFRTNAISRKGAVGVMQLMPSTAARYGVTNLKDPVRNLDAGVRHLKHLLSIYGGNVALTLAAYNAGEGAVEQSKHRIPPYQETMLYVPMVLARWRSANQ